MPGVVRGAIELRDVAFAYPSAPQKPVCAGLSLSITAGQVCALVGPSGSGKSTIVQLLERFYDPQVGCVLLDGCDIRRQLRDVPCRISMPHWKYQRRRMHPGYNHCKRRPEHLCRVRSRQVPVCKWRSGVCRLPSRQLLH